MKLLRSDQMRQIDQAASRHGVSTADLMDRAGEKTAYYAAARMAEAGLALAVAVCGGGNNGGDGLAAALHLKRTGHKAMVLLLCSPDEIKGDPAAFLAAARKEKLEVAYLDPAGLTGQLKEIAEPHLIIDALFGTGFRPPARAPWTSAIEAVNASGRKVLAVDLPSGLGADDGRIAGPSVRADWTVTFGAPKAPLFIHPAAGLAGTVVVAGIGHPPALIEDHSHRSLLLEAGWCREMLGTRMADSHKGTYGHVLVVAGSVRLPGAALLTALGAVRGGAGLVTLAAPGSLAGSFAPTLPEVLPASLPQAGDGSLAEGSAEAILGWLEGMKALVIGPGLTPSESVGKTVARLLEAGGPPIVVDADALNVLARDPSPLSLRRHPIILTPHPGEMARLLGISRQEVQADRVSSVLEAARRFGAVTVLKGAGTLVGTPGGDLRVNASGNPGMAAGGMGDVLSGLIGAFLAQGFPPDTAACLGVYLHGLAGDLAAADIGPFGFTARELADYIPSAAAEVMGGHDDIERL